MLVRLMVVLLLAIILWSGLFAKTASSQLVESRLNNLEADFNRLESRLANLEAQTNRIPPTQARTSPTLSTITPTQRRNLTQSQRDQMFDRLATLVVEVKEQVNSLEARVKKLEAR
jgi:BMFP domain-containing protein YqiC